MGDQWPPALADGQCHLITPLRIYKQQKTVRVLRQAQDARNIIAKPCRRMLSSVVKNEIPTCRDRIRSPL